LALLLNLHFKISINIYVFLLNDKFQKQKRVKKSSLNDEEVEIEDAHCSSSVGTLTALLPLPDVAASSSEQVTPEQVGNAALLASSVFCRPAGPSVSSYFLYW
jgi:hypothetical protein